MTATTTLLLDSTMLRRRQRLLPLPLLLLVLLLEIRTVKSWHPLAVEHLTAVYPNDPNVRNRRH